MIRLIIKNIPNSITCLNLICGVAACVFSFHYRENLGGLCGYEWAWIFMGAAAVFDFCDGAAARLFHAYSDLGKQLDSLSDLISFGLAPTLLIFNLSVWGNYGSMTWWAFLSFIIAVCGALRLAKFNIDDSQQTSFKGLPIPANAIFWIGFSAWIQNHSFPANWIVSLIIIAISYMMICPMTMFSLKFKNFDLSENLMRFLLLGGAVILFLTLGIAGFAATIILYIIMSAFSNPATVKSESIPH